MDNTLPVPAALRHKFDRVSDNRQPGQGVTYNAEAFCEIFKDELQQWLDQRAQHQARTR